MSDITYEKYDESDSDDDSMDDKFEFESHDKEAGDGETGEIIDEEKDDSSADDDDLKTDSESDGEEIDKAPQMPTFSHISSIRNKFARQKEFKKYKQKRKEAKKQLREIRVKEAKKKGVKLKKKVPSTIESKRVIDEAIADREDEDLMTEDASDKYAKYYEKTYEPKVLVTGSQKLNGRSIRFVKELCLTIPNSHPLWRRTSSVRKTIEDASQKDFTDLLIVNEDARRPVIHLPSGPSAYFRLSNIKLCKEIKRKAKDITGHRPEIILNNFKTRLGRVVARMFGALYHFEPEFKGRSVCTFHNQRDYIFFRHHRYQFRSEEKVSLRELGPRFTLRIQWLKDGAFDGDYEWTLKRHEMETSRCKFQL